MLSIFWRMCKKILYAQFLLLIPLIGMMLTDEIDWDIFDFLIKGTLLLVLGIVIHIIKNKITPFKKQKILIALLLMILILIWVELAVGVLGSSFAGS